MASRSASTLGSAGDDITTNRPADPQRATIYEVNCIGTRAIHMTSVLVVAKPVKCSGEAPDWTHVRAGLDTRAMDGFLDGWIRPDTGTWNLMVPESRSAQHVSSL